MICREIVLQNVVFTQHVLNAFFAFLNLNFLLRNCMSMNFLIDDKAVVWHFVIVIVLFRSFWMRILLFFFKTAVLWVTHVTIWRGFGVWSYDDGFGFIFLGLFDIWCLDGKISAFFAFSFILSAGGIDITNDIFVHF